jgi:phosphatidylglycerophosphatase A
MLTTFGLGYLRPASGTWGSMPPAAIAGLILLAGWLLAPGGEPTPDAAIGWPPALWIIYHATLIAILLAFSLACIMWGDVAEATFRRKDPGQVVADETAGQCIMLMLLPWPAVSDPFRAAVTIGCLFIAFRILDIIKPFPAGRLQALRSGWGILIDDIIVGLQGAVLAQVVLRVLL